MIDIAGGIIFISYSLFLFFTGYLAGMRDKNVVIEQPEIEAIPEEEVRQFIESIQKIKDNHNEHGKPINYGTICGILIEGYGLLDKYMEGKDGNDD